MSSISTNHASITYGQLRAEAKKADPFLRRCFLDRVKVVPLPKISDFKDPQIKRDLSNFSRNSCIWGGVIMIAALAGIVCSAVTGIGCPYTIFGGGVVLFVTREIVGKVITNKLYNAQNKLQVPREVLEKLRESWEQQNMYRQEQGLHLLPELSPALLGPITPEGSDSDSAGSDIQMYPLRLRSSTVSGHSITHRELLISN